MKVATCQLLTGQDDECQLGHSQLRKDLVQFRLFLPELVLRLRLAADFRPWVRIPCYWLMACALLEICLFLVAATRLQWRRLRAKGLKEEAIWEQELLVWAFLVGWHEVGDFCGTGGEIDPHDEDMCTNNPLDFLSTGTRTYTHPPMHTKLLSFDLPCITYTHPLTPTHTHRAPSDIHTPTHTQLLSYLVHYLYYDSHTLCDGSGLFFRDAMTLFTMAQVRVCVSPFDGSRGKGQTEACHHLLNRCPRRDTSSRFVLLRHAHTPHHPSTHTHALDRSCNAPS